MGRPKYAAFFPGMFLVGGTRKQLVLHPHAHLKNGCGMKTNNTSEGANMDISAKRHSSLLLLLFTVFCTVMLFVKPGPAASEDRQIVSGPYSLSLRGGALNDSGTIGADGRVDYLNPVLNVHIFGSYDLMDASSGLGAVDSQRYGAGFALSHTYPGKANVFVGTAFINELSEYFGHVYFGGKLKVSETTLLSASYGVGLGPNRNIGKLTKFLTAQSVDWGKVGAAYVTPSGFKTNLSYYLTDPGGENISGLEGEASYPVSDSVSVGVNGSVDLTEKSTIDRDWKGYAFVTYAFGSQKGTPIDVALDKNSPIAYPKVLRVTGSRAAAVSTLSISPAATSNYGYGGPASTFTASGGTAPYTWSTPDSNGMTVLNATQASWQDTDFNYCTGTNYVTVTVTDATLATASAVITVSGCGGVG